MATTVTPNPKTYAHGQWIPDASTTDEYTLAHRAHYLFSPVESFPLDAMRYSLKQIRKRRIELVKTKHYPERSTDEDIMKGQVQPYLKSEQNPSAGQVDSLIELYGETGVIVIRALLGAPEAIKDWAEGILVPGEFKSLVAFQQHIAGMRLLEAIEEAELPAPLRMTFMVWKQNAPEFTPANLLEAVRSELEASAVRGEQHVRAYTGDYLSEMTDAARTGKKGIGVVKPKMREMCGELEVQPPDDRQAEIDRLRSQAANQAAAGQPAQIVLQQPGDGIERAQCPRCNEPVALRNGVLPSFCKHCGANPRELAEEALAAAQREIKPLASEAERVDDGEEDRRATASLKEPETPAAETKPETPAATLAEKSEAVFGGESNGGAAPATTAKPKQSATGGARKRNNG